MATTLTKDIIKKGIGLGTIDPRILTDFFYKVKLKSYDYDYLIQEDLVDLYSVRSSFKEAFDHSKLIKGILRTGYLDRVAALQIDKGLVYYAKRKEFKDTTGLNGTPMSQDTVMLHRDIFKFGLLVFINNKLTTDFKIEAKDDKTALYFPYKDFMSTIKDTDVVDTVFIPRSVIYTSRTLAGTDKPDSSSIALNSSTFNALYTNKKVLDECTGFIAFFNPIGSVTSSSKLRTDVTYDKTNSKFVFSNSGTLPAAANMNQYTLTIIGMEDYQQVIDVTPDTKYLEITKQKMPIPKNNLLVMVREDDGITYHLNYDEIVITEKYPNIYQITNANNRYCKIIVLYNSAPQDDLLDYDTEIDSYLEKVNLLDRYRQGTVPDGLTTYKPIDWDYLIKDFEKNTTITDTSNLAWYPLLYKLNKVNEIYKLWCYFFEYYISQTYGFLDGWTLDLSTTNLATRARTDTLPELDLGSGYYKIFDTPQYLFVYKNYTRLQSHVPYSWFIDNKFRVPSYMISYKGYEYVYFDQSYIKSNSIVEVERYDENNWVKQYTIPVDGLTVKFSWISEPFLINSLFMTHTDGTYITTGKEYNFIVTDSILGDITVDMTNSVYKIKPGDSVKIVPVSSDYANKTVNLYCNNHAVVYSMTFDSEYSTFNDMNLNLGKDIAIIKPNYIPRLRVYNGEGRLFPKYSYSKLITIEDNSVLTPPAFRINVPASEGNPFQVQYMGYDEKQVYACDEIPVNGYLDLQALNAAGTGNFRHPFSLKYYDVFLNGFKLNSTQIRIITPFYIAIQNVRTRKSLVIYEKIPGDETFYFASGDSSTYLADKLFNIDSTYYTNMINSLSDIIEDTSITDMISEVNAIKLSFYRDWVAKNFIDADDTYPPSELDTYEIMFDSWRYLFNADERITRNVDSRNVFFINHDFNIDAVGK